LRSLLPPYQRGVETNDYEIILIDNGSAKILDDETRTILPNLQYIYVPPRLLDLAPGATVEVRGWHLGPKW
jgi:hypothetical protein